MFCSTKTKAKNSAKLLVTGTVRQKLDDFIDFHVRMFEHFGGVPEFVVPENCLTAVTKAKKHDVKLNESYQDMCKH
jgi:transposase